MPFITNLTTGLSKEDIDFYEIKAFASQALMSIKHIGLPLSIVHPVGGAIALGHPLGCTGARQIATGFATAKREGKKVFVTSMCMRTGMVSLAFLRLGMEKKGGLMAVVGLCGDLCERAVSGKRLGLSSIRGRVWWHSECRK
ncbi:hypothetical protein L198_06942 [Cryptococcus wingfieldii CBS 7118]|uniref:Thiolase C-terminal domain-containing protein n=1 Tax=Cryptococcus wingfieldii CBS 7118 TaxID=1295528 RepID=A0A1E3IH20_9TREE|nr:hypothetical protein L198_06942 [Cryptococcus wingfieldii CBS 7118]ODN87715.1 hypothetical protein L198_06942 [Cryptococcus wingfieldii CBS 7118]